MAKIDITGIRAVEDELFEQVKDLNKIIEQLEAVSSGIKGMIQAESVISDICRLREELEEEIFTHKSMAESLEIITKIYMEAEADIVSVYEFEKKLYSLVKIGTYDTSVTENIDRFGVISLE